MLLDIYFYLSLLTCTAMIVTVTIAPPKWGLHVLEYDDYIPLSRVTKIMGTGGIAVFLLLMATNHMAPVVLLITAGAFTAIVLLIWATRDILPEFYEYGNKAFAVLGVYLVTLPVFIWFIASHMRGAWGYDFPMFVAWFGWSMDDIMALDAERSVPGHMHVVLEAARGGMLKKEGSLERNGTSSPEK